MRVAIVEDGVLLREGVVHLLGAAGHEVVAQFGDVDGLLAYVRDDPPDVVILDIRLPPTHTDEGLRAALDLREHQPDVGVLVLSQYVELGLAMKLLADSAEGVGYLLKDRVSDVEEFVAAVERVAGGGSALDPIIVSTLLSRRRRDDPLSLLTPREREVLELMATGSSNQGIADALVITLRAVEKYVSSIFGKLGLPSSSTEDSRRVLAVLMYLRPDAFRTATARTARPIPQKPERCGPPACRLGAGARLRHSMHQFTRPLQEGFMRTRIIQRKPKSPDAASVVLGGRRRPGARVARPIALPRGSAVGAPRTARRRCSSGSCSSSRPSRPARCTPCR